MICQCSSRRCRLVRALLRFRFDRLSSRRGFRVDVVIVRCLRCRRLVRMMRMLLLLLLTRELRMPIYRNAPIERRIINITPGIVIPTIIAVVSRRCRRIADVVRCRARHCRTQFPQYVLCRRRRSHRSNAFALRATLRRDAAAAGDRFPLAGRFFVVRLAVRGNGEREGRASSERRPPLSFCDSIVVFFVVLLQDYDV